MASMPTAKPTPLLARPGGCEFASNNDRIAHIGYQQYAGWCCSSTSKNWPSFLPVIAGWASNCW
jgi:hypothetical protein